MRLNKLAVYGLLSVAVSAAVVVSLGRSYIAQAATFGVAIDQGFYNKVQYSANNHRFYFLDGIPLDYATAPTTADKFINQMYTYLYNLGTPDQIAEQDAARASVIINIMMGSTANDPRYVTIDPTKQPWENGVTLAKQRFDEWAKIVRAYDQKDPAYGGSVDFNGYEFSPKGTINGSGVGIWEPLNWDSKTAPRGAAHGDLPDVVFGQLNTDEGQDAIIFTHSLARGGGRFVIKKWCGNIIGDNEVPFPVQWFDQANIATTGTTPPNGTSIVGGTAKTMTFSGTATNTGTTLSGASGLTAWVDVTYGSTTTNKINLSPTDPAPIAALQPGETSNPAIPFSYNIPANAPAGTQYCFYTQASPASTSGGTSTSSKICYAIAFSSYPAIQGTNGDIHAGGGICGLLPYSTGNASGNSSAPSVGDYVVSASGLLQNFNSNGGIAPNNLLLSPNGGYARACRPDLLAAATAGRNASYGVIPAATTSVDLTTLTGVAGGPEVYYWDGGGELAISGTVRSKVTIVATLGNMRINNKIMLTSASYSPRTAPSLGLIAQGNISIDSTVSQIDAFLFSNGTINTCVQQNNTCATKLQVNGFIMGKNVLFYRLGTPNTSGVQISEKVTLLPQLYLNPPKFFDAATQSLQAQGEQPPLY